jgi:hypothetical protein
MSGVRACFLYAFKSMMSWISDTFGPEKLTHSEVPTVSCFGVTVDKSAYHHQSHCEIAGGVDIYSAEPHISGSAS